MMAQANVISLFSRCFSGGGRGRSYLCWLCCEFMEHSGFSFLPKAVTLTTRVNGQVVQHDSTANMIFSVATAIAFLSSLMTLEPGDIIATGTPSGVGFKRTPPLFLQDGDVVEVEIERIGRLRNPVRRGRS